MKNKFDLVFENIMATLKKAEVDYELVSDFKKKVEKYIKNATQQNISVIIKQLKKSIKFDDPSKEDKLNQLKKICQKKFDKKLIEKIFK